VRERKTESDQPPIDAVHCVNCGYPLTGLDPAGECPECGADIERTLKGGRLVDASPEYVGTLANAAGLLAVAIAAFPLARIGVLLSDEISSNAATPEQAETWLYIMRFCRLILLAVYICCACGWWWFTAPDPGMQPGDRYEILRKRLRHLLCAIVGLALAETAMHLVIPASPPKPWTLDTFTGGLMLLCLVMFYVYSLQYIEWLSMRIPSPALLKAGSRTQLACPTAIVCALAALFLHGSIPDWALVAIIIIFILIAFGAYVRLLIMLRRALLQVRRDHRERYG
jgi:predicted RNA-binding Zn-ribbon protein involved in translation (DUF1610 family)